MLEKTKRLQACAQGIFFCKKARLSSDVVNFLLFIQRDVRIIPCTAHKAGQI
jgi:hypothetical protein